LQSQVIIDAVLGVTKKWAKQRKAEERCLHSVLNRRQALVRSARVTIKDAAWQCMRDAYWKASTNNTLPAQARQIMYAARGEIQRRAGRALDDQYFCQTLLPDYMSEHPDETAGWDVVFDARGHFTEPHTDRVVPLGTIDVRSYLSEVVEHKVAGLELLGSSPEIPSLYPTCGPLHRYAAILFIEKEGFMPLFAKVKLAERYDLAIMSTKGLSVTASRLLVERLCSVYHIPLLVLHDFDKSGFSIIGTLRRPTRRYQFQKPIQVIDLGLRLKDVEAEGLEAEDVAYGKSDPTENLLTNGATSEEVRFLNQGRVSGGYRGKRVELNAFTSGELIAWIESKLQEHGIKKLIPEKETVEAAYRRAFAITLRDRRLEEIAAEVIQEAQQAAVPEWLAEEVRERLEEDPSLAWDEVLAELAVEETKD
jgi:hypothetical protein